MTIRTATMLLGLAMIVLSPEVSPATAQRTQRLTLRSDDGVNIAATWYEPANRPAPAVVLVHMLARSRRDWDAVGNRLASEGIGALAIDLRGHGESPGDASNLAAMVNDVKAAKRHLVTRTDVIHSRIGIAGASFGASVAALAAAEDSAVVSVVLLSPSLDYRGVKIEPALKKYGARPALLVAGTDDGFAVRSVRDLSKGAGGTREVLLLDNAGHGTNMFAKAGDLGRQLVDWFHRTLQ